MALTVKPQDQSIFPEDVWRISVDRYHQMIDAAIITADDPVELLDGRIIEKMPKKPSHSTITAILFHLLFQLVGNKWLIRNQEPITLTESEPEPDIAVANGGFDTYRDRHPGSADVYLIIEVADATLARDRGIKKELYAAANIPVYWGVNLVDSQVEVYSRPLVEGQRADYGEQRLFNLGDNAIPVVIDGHQIGEIALSDLFKA